MICKCGSDSHSRTSSKNCPLYRTRPGKEKSIRKDNCIQEYSVYKQGFNSLCKNKLLYDNVTSTVKNATKICYYATKLLQLHLQRICETDDISIPDITDITWLRQLFTHKYNDHYLEESANLLPYLPHLKINGQVITYLTKELRQNIQMYLENVYDIMTKKWIFNILRIRGFHNKITKQVINEIFESNNNMFGFYDIYEFHKRSIESKIKRMYYYNNLFVGWGTKQFTLCPNYSTCAKYITVDTDVLHSFVGSNEKVREFGLNCLDRWRKHINIKNKWLNGTNKNFNMMIKTDGMGVSVILYKWVPKKRIHSEEEKFIIDENTSFIGVDPGRRDVISCCDSDRI